MNISTIYKLYEKGFFKVEPDSLFNPNVLIYDKQDKNLNKLFVASKQDNRGVHILVNTEKQNGNYWVQVGVSGVSGEDTLFKRLEVIHRQKEEKWDKAILIFDWQDDIAAWLSQAEDISEENRTKIIDEILDSEVFQLKKFLQYELNQTASKLNLKVDDRGLTKPVIQDINSKRFNYYLELVKHLLHMTTEGYFKYS